jgi:hypothetical protein
VAIILIFLLPRKYVILPSLLMVFLVPFGQVVVMGGIHFTVYRIVVLCGLIRFAASKPDGATSRLAGGFNSVDMAFTLFAVLSFVTFTVQWLDVQALIKALGSFLDVLGGYIVARFLIQDRADVVRAIKVFGVIAMILAVCMANEQLTRQNIFGYLGGIERAVAVREGKARSTGVFEVYITAGVFGATLLPLLVWLWSEGKSRILAALAIVGATVMTITSNSSTPLLAYVAGIVGLCFWPLRKQMRSFRWGLLLVLVGLHLVMKAPVWALIARIDLTGSSSGYHRYMLVDGCIRHFSDWWLIGFKNYNDWGWDMWDLSNQYVAYALTGGLATLGAFLLVISRSFGQLGTARKSVQGNIKDEWFLWCLCAALLSHVVAYFGIGYFDQMQFAWYVLLALFSAAIFEAIQVSAPEGQEAIISAYSSDRVMNWEMLENNQ